MKRCLAVSSLHAGIFSAITLSSTIAMANTWDTLNILSAETRFFPDDASFVEQHDGLHLSLSYQAELRWKNDADNQRISAIGFTRYDQFDNHRSHSDIRELYWAFDASDWSLLVGINKVFWGVTESRHLVDVINQTDQVEDIDQEDKLGQPMINISWQQDWGLLETFILPYFRPATTIGTEGRLRGPFTINNNKAEFESSREERHIDAAIRYSHFLGDLDFAFNLFYGTSREARLALDITNTQAQFIPLYDLMLQGGVELQYTADSWLWKLEAIYRDLENSHFFASVVGFEYTQSQISNSNLDIGWLVEFLYDDRDMDLTPNTFFDRDLFLGARLAFNDAQDTSILAGVITDLDTQEAFFNVEAERRLTDNLTAEIRARALTNTENSSLLHAIRNDDYIQLQISWYF